MPTVPRDPRQPTSAGAASAPADPATVRPCWNPRRRELTLDGKLVKRFRRPASNQELILAAFEEEGWPEAIDDPLPGSPGTEPGDRLHNALQRLNAGQHEARILFRRNGAGGILWAG